MMLRVLMLPPCFSSRCRPGVAEPRVKSKCPSWRGKATVRPRRQGRRGVAFIGASGNPCTEEADGSGAGFSQEGQANQIARSQGKHLPKMPSDLADPE